MDISYGYVNVIKNVTPADRVSQHADLTKIGMTLYKRAILFSPAYSQRLKTVRKGISFMMGLKCAILFHLQLPNPSQDHLKKQNGYSLRRIHPYYFDKILDTSTKPHDQDLLFRDIRVLDR